MSDIIVCPICGFETENLCWPHIKMHGYSDTASFKKQFSLIYLKSDRLRQKQSSFMMVDNPTKGQKRTDEEKSKMSLNRLGKGIGISGKYERTPEIIRRISIGVTNAYQRGDFDLAQPGRGTFIFAKKANKTIFVRSTWEQRIVAVLDTCEEIEYYDYEPFVIPYMFEGAAHNYIPDLLIRGIYGVIELCEIKRDDFIDKKDPKTMAKIAALEEYCSQKKYNSRVLKLKDIQKLEKIVSEQNAKRISNYSK